MHFVAYVLNDGVHPPMDVYEKGNSCNNLRFYKCNCILLIVVIRLLCVCLSIYFVYMSIYYVLLAHLKRMPEEWLIV